VRSIVEAAGASGALWLGAGDSLVSCHLAKPMARHLLDEEAFAFVDVLVHRHNLEHAPAFPEVDLDEAAPVGIGAAPPTERVVLPARVSGVTIGGIMLLAEKPFEAADEDFAEAALALGIALQLRQLQRQIDATSDRLSEISEVGRIFADVGEPARTISRILELAIRSSEAETGAIIHALDDGTLVSTGVQFETLSSIRFRSGSGLVDRALASSAEILLPPALIATELDVVSTSLVIDSLAAFPLTHEMKRYGTMILVNIPGPLLGDSAFIAMLGTIARLAASAMTSEERQAERIEQELTRKELAAARSIQQSLLPSDMPSVHGFSVAGLWHPSRTVGGDYFDVFPLGEDRIGVVIADVSGKGIPAGLLMAISRSYLRVTAAAHPESPSTVLRRINALLCREMSSSKFITANYLVIDAASRKGRLANAGHHEPLLLEPGGGARLLCTDSLAGGLPLGIVENAEYEDLEFELKPGTTMLLYTDGLIETRNPVGALWGIEGLRRFAAGRSGMDPEALLGTLWQETQRYSAGEGPEDDWTTVAIACRETG
jgi:serine phosphatase RsbU (regulator of sigma subunit)